VADVNPSNVYSVEIHRHYGERDYLEDITGIVMSSQLTQPFGTCRVSVMLRVNQLNRVIPGNWLVVRDARGFAVWWGYVSDVAEQLAVNQLNAIAITPVEVTAISWLDLLIRSEVSVPFGYTKSEGMLFSLEDWLRISDEVLKPYVTADLGGALELMFQRAAKIRLPDTLGGEWLGDAITVVHNKDTGRLYTPELEVEAVPNVGGTLNQMQLQSFRGSLYQLLVSMFAPEPKLIELFSYLANFEDITGPEAEAEFEATIQTGRAEEVPRETTANTFSTRYPQVKATALAKALRARPSLVYRIAPWRLRPLRETVYSAVGTDRFVSPERSVQTTFDEMTQADLDDTSDLDAPMSFRDPLDRTSRVDSGFRAVSTYTPDYKQQLVLNQVFDETTWRYGELVYIPDEYVELLSRTRSDNNRVNVSTIGIPGEGGPEASETLGLPIKISEEIIRHGSRTVKPVWPFYPGEQGQTDYVMFLRSLCAQILQFHAKSHVFGSGVVRTTHLQALEDNRNPLVSLRAGQGFAVGMPRGTEPFFAYAVGVTHALDINETNGVRGRTTINYTRGLFGEDEDALRDSLVPVNPNRTIVVPTPQTSPATAPAQGGAGDPANFIWDNEVRRPVGFPVRHLMLENGSQMLLSDTKSLVFHTNAGPNETTVQRLHKRFLERHTAATKQTSAHFVVDTNGDVYQFVDIAYCAWHTEGGAPFDGEGARPPNFQYNFRSIGIEFLLPSRKLFDPIKAGGRWKEARRGETLNLGDIPSEANRAADLAKASREWWAIFPSSTYYADNAGDITYRSWMAEGTGSSQYRPFIPPTHPVITNAQRLGAARLVKALVGFRPILASHRRGPFFFSPYQFARIPPQDAWREVVRGGVFHHAQLSNIREDALGADLDDILRIARSGVTP